MKSPQLTNAKVSLAAASILYLVLSGSHVIGSEDLHRAKRQIPTTCPSEAADSVSNTIEAKILFHPPTPKSEEITIESNKNNDWDIDDLDLIEKSGFNSSQPTIIYVHAFIQNPHVPWLNEARRKYETMFTDDDRPLFNMFFYDWSKYSQKLYHFSTKWVPNSGIMLGRFIAGLNSKLGHDPSNVHLISFSLSAHVAGQAGRELTRKGLELGQITAIDPTGVCFHHDTEFGNAYMLQSTDADLVVSRHYDLNEYGAHKLINGLEIFINGGQKQYTPLMVQKRSVDENGLDDGDDDRHSVGGMLSHWLGTALESSRTDCESVAYECESYTEFLAGGCAECGDDNSKCYYMDNLKSTQLQQSGAYYETRPQPGTQMFIETGKSQKCLYTYQVVARVKADASKVVTNAFISGFVEFDAGISKTFSPTHLLQDNAFSTLVALDTKLKFPDYVKVSSKGTSGLQVKDTIESLEIKFMSHPLRQVRAENSAKYCAGIDINLDGTLQKC